MVFLFLASLAACKRTSRPDGLHIHSASPEGEIPTESNLTFYLSANLAPDSVFGTWDKTSYIAFDPPVSGEFRWTGANVLEFSPSQPWQPGTDYRATLQEAVRQFDPESRTLATDHAWSFNTPDVALRSVNVFWTKPEGATQPVLEANLGFNYPVESAAVLNLLSVKTGVKAAKNAVGVQGLPVSQSNEIPLRLDALPEEAGELVFELAAGLMAKGGNRRGEKPFSISTAVPDRSRLQVLEFAAQHDGTRGMIRVVFNQNLVADPALKAGILLNPTAAFKLDFKGNELLLESSVFALEDAYTLTIPSQLKGELGGEMAEPYRHAFSFGQLRPEVRFVSSKGQYLSSRGPRNLAVAIHSVAEVEVTVVKVFENNIQAFLRQGKDYDGYYDWEGDEEYYGYQYYETEPFGEEIWRKTYRTKDLPESGPVRLLQLDFQDKLPRFHGVYVVKVSSTDKQYLTDTRVVSVSDLGLVAKVTPGQVTVFAHSLKTAKPIAGLEVVFFSTHNQLMHQAKTDADGVAVWEAPESGGNGFEVGMVSASGGSDYNFLAFNQSGVDASRYDVGGVRTESMVYDAYLYGERDLYRPGETAHFAAVLRDWKDWDRPGPLPVQIRFRQPDGRLWKTVRQALDDEGSLAVTLPLAPSAPTGPWSADLFTGNDVFLTSFRFSVEEFVPDRMRINTALGAERYLPGDSLTGSLQALHFYGPPAAGRKWEADISLDRENIVFDGWPGWNFDPRQSMRERYTESGLTDASGIGLLGLTLPETEEVGLISGKVRWTVFDETGRAVYGSNTFRLQTQPLHYGIGPSPEYCATRSPLRIGLAVVNTDGMAQSRQVDVEVIKVDWESNMVRQGNQYRYESREVERPVSREEVAVSGAKSSFVFVPKQSGKYLMRIRKPGSKSYVERSFYAYGSGDTDYRSFEVNNEGQVDISTDKPSYQVGETAEILFKTPFEGRLVVTLERDRVHQKFFLQTSNRTASLQIKLPGEWLPTAYISATLIRPGDGPSMPLTVAHGFLPLAIEDAVHRLPVTIKVPGDSRSRRTVTATVKTTPGAYLTIAAVDQGILQISGMEDPDPYVYFFRKRALEVQSYDLYGQLFPDLFASGGLTGGDGGYELAARSSPITAERFKLISHWSGIVKADAGGNAKFSVDLPEFSGELHWMVAAWKGSAFGAASSATTVADPLVLASALPRFLSPGDEVDMAVMVANTTDGKAQGKVSIKTEGALEIVGTREQSFVAEAHRETSVRFRVRAGKAMGTGSVRVVASGLGEQFEQVTELAVRPASGLQHLIQEGQVAGGTQVSLVAPSTFDVVTGTRLTVGRSPALALTGDLDYLIQYPYGCMEQIISTAFPQLYLGELAGRRVAEAGGDGSGLTSGNNGAGASGPGGSAAAIREAIARIQSQQISNGGLTYWQGVGEAQWWVSAYAAHFLHEAKKAGYSVDAIVQNKLLGFLKTKVRQRETFLYRYNVNQSREVAVKEIAYSLYVLALAGEADISTMNYYKSHPDWLALDSKYLLASCYGLAGDREQFDRLLPRDFLGEESLPAFSGSFHSAIRDRALALNALLQIQPDHPQVGPLARFLSEQLNTARWLNTQERAFSLIALGKIAQRNAGSTATGIVYVNGREVARIAEKEWSMESDVLQDGEIRLEVSGKGNLYYVMDQKGYATDGRYAQEDRFLKVRKRFLDRNGVPVTNLLNLRQNDLLVVEIELKSPAGVVVENVAITDLLPAGLEIENTRLRGMKNMEWIKGASVPDYLDVRDDRINFFTDAQGETQRFYYMVRAVSPGRFQMGPVQADAMYNGQYHSAHGAGVIEIKP